MKTRIAALLSIVIIFASCSLFLDYGSDEEKIIVEKITIAEESVYMAVTQVSLIDVEILPLKHTEDVVLEITSPEVADAALDNNLLTVTGKAIGSTLIRIKSKNITKAITINVVTDDSINPSIYLVAKDPVVRMDLSEIKSTSVSLYGNTANYGYTWTINDSSIADINSNQKTAVITPKKSGTAVINVTHSSTAFGCQILLMVEDDVIDNAKVITTDYNIIQMYDDMDNKTINVGLINGTSDDNSEFSFQIENTSIATVVSNNEEAIITPISAGLTYLIASHPDAAYDSRILLNIISKEFLSYIETSINYIEIEGDRHEITAVIRGPGSEEDIIWISNDTSIARVNGYGETAFVEGGNIEGETTITVSHPKIKAETTIYVRNTPNTTSSSTYDDNSLITSTNYMKIVAGQFDYYYLSIAERYLGSSKSLVNPIGTVNEGMDCFIANPYVATVEETATPGEYMIRGLSEGSTTILFFSDKTDKTAELKVVVYPEGTDINTVNTPYLQSNTTTVYLNKSTAYRNLSIDMMGSFGSIEPYITDPEDYIEWDLNVDNIVSITTDGTNAEIKPLNMGECWLTVSHPESSNKLYISIVVEGDVASLLDSYITTGNNLVTVVANGLYRDINVQPMGFTDTTGYEWHMNDITVATVEETGSTSARIRGQRAGTAELTVTHEDSDFSIKIYVNVLAEGSTIGDPKYITTSQNTVSIIAGMGTKSIGTTLVNGASADNVNFVWTNSDNSLMTLSADQNNAILAVTDAGSGIITVTHPLADYPLTIHVKAYEIAPDGSIIDEYGNVVDPGNGGISVDVPYITTEQDLIYVVAEGATQVIEVRGVGTTDNSNFTWEVGNENILEITDYGNYAVLDGITEGDTVISVSHPEAPFPIEILVRILAPGSTIPNTPYISSGQNVITLEPGGTSKNVQVSLYGGNLADNIDFVWTNNDTDVFTLSANGRLATITPVDNGQGEITITHPKSANSYSIKVIVTDGTTGDIGPYITTTQEIYKIEKNEAITITATLQNSTNSQQKNLVWTKDSEDIFLTYNGNTGYITATDRAGVYEVIISHPLAGIDKKITVIVNSTDPDDLSDPSLIEGNYITLNKKIIIAETTDNISINATIVGGTETDKNNFTWTLDNSGSISITTNADNAIITPHDSGVTRITVSHPLAIYDTYVTVIVGLPGDNVSLGDIVFIENPNQFVKVVEGSNSQQLSVNLVGGTSTDNANFMWTVEDTRIATIQENGNTAVVKGITPGQTRIHITHPLSDFDSYMIVNVTNKPIGTDIYLESSEDIITMTMQDTETIEVELKNGTAIDFNNITWDVDNITVVDLSAVRGVASITPVGEGTAMITASHPLSNNSLSFRVNVSEYFEFKFSKNSETMIEGESVFIPIRVPSYSTVPTTITYTTTNALVAVAEGTAQTVEITAITAGLATITATSNHGETSEILVRVEEAPPEQNEEIYVTCNRTTVDVDEGDNSFSINASLVGGSTLDQQGIVWTSGDTSVLSILGSGPSVIVTPLDAGETTITISHPLSETVHVIHARVNGVIYPLTLEDVYLQLKEGESVELSAFLDSAPPSAYERIIWTTSNAEICRVTGYGETVTLVGMGGGTAYITAQYPGGTARQCEIDVDPTPYLIFHSSTTVKVAPGESLNVQFSHNPQEAPVAFVSSNTAAATFTVDQANEVLTIYGNDDGTAVITGEIMGVQTSLTVTVQKAYSVNASLTSINSDPLVTPFTYTLYPSGSDISVTSANPGIATVSVNTATRTVTISPVAIGSTHITLRNNTAVLTIPVTWNQPAVTFSLQKVSTVGNTNATYVNGNTITIQDGESAGFQIVPSNNYVTVTGISLQKTTGSGYSASTISPWKYHDHSSNGPSDFTDKWGSVLYNAISASLNGLIINVSCTNQSFYDYIYSWQQVNVSSYADVLNPGYPKVRTQAATYTNVASLVVSYRVGSGATQTLTYNVTLSVNS